MRDHKPFALTIIARIYYTRPSLIDWINTYVISKFVCYEFIMFQTVLSYIPVIRNYFPAKNEQISERKTPSIIKQADILFENKRYDNVYELLQTYKVL